MRFHRATIGLLTCATLLQVWSRVVAAGLSDLRAERQALPSGDLLAFSRLQAKIHGTSRICTFLWEMAILAFVTATITWIISRWRKERGNQVIVAVALLAMLAAYGSHWIGL